MANGFMGPPSNHQVCLCYKKLITQGLLINSGTVGLLTKIVQLKTRIAVNSGTIYKIRNEEINHFSRKAPFHELIMGTLI